MFVAARPEAVVYAVTLVVVSGSVDGSVVACCGMLSFGWNVLLSDETEGHERSVS